MKKLNVIHILVGWEYCIIGVADNDEDVKKLIRQYVKSDYETSQHYIGPENPSLTIYGVMRKAANLFHSIKVESVNVNEFACLMQYI